MYSSVALFFVVLIAGNALCSAAPRKSPFFSPNGAFNALLPDNAPISSQSTSIVKNLTIQIEKYGLWINTNTFGHPIYTVNKSQTTSAVRLDHSSYEDPDLIKAWEKVPIAPDTHPAGGSDESLVIHRPETDELWEFWLMRKENTTNPKYPNEWNWVAAWGGYMANVSHNPGVYQNPHPYWGGSATSISYAGGTVLVSEAQAGAILHALSMCIVEAGPGHVAPAQRDDGWSGFKLAPFLEGTRFRLPPKTNVSAIAHPFARMVATAIRDYGILVTDKGGAVVLYNEDSTQYGKPDPWDAIFAGVYPNHILEQIPWNLMQVVDPVWQPWVKGNPWYQPTEVSE